VHQLKNAQAYVNFHLIVQHVTKNWLFISEHLVDIKKYDASLAHLEVSILERIAHVADQTRLELKRCTELFASNLLPELIADANLLTCIFECLKSATSAALLSQDRQGQDRAFIGQCMAKCWETFNLVKDGELQSEEFTPLVSILNIPNLIRLWDTIFVTLDCTISDDKDKMWHNIKQPCLALVPTKPSVYDLALQHILEDVNSADDLAALSGSVVRTGQQSGLVGTLLKSFW
jgi:hypothetical protein